MEQDMSLFQYDLIRNDLLRELLGSEHEQILYWGGKTIARKYELHTLEDMIDFFLQAGWGSLQIQKDKPQIKILELQGPWMGKEDKRCYHLEAGFLAQQIEHIHSLISEATYETKKNQ
ncbi:hypothetical protein BTS2_1041 [Bacillus sp. TS-2]|nr:hypothetical protein BTS2_1041 [Bacillus sp. TS-2]